MAKNSVEPDGEKLRSLRIGRGLSSEALAQVALCSVRSVQNAESGKNIHVTTLGLLAKALGVGPNELILGLKPPEPSSGKIRVEITIDADIDKLNNSPHIYSLIELLTKMIPGSNEITVTGVRDGSMIVTLEMNAADAEILAALFPGFHEKAREVIRDKAIYASKSADYMERLREAIYRKPDEKYYTSVHTMNAESYYLAYLTDMLMLADGVRDLTVLADEEDWESGSLPAVQLSTRTELEISPEILGMVGFTVGTSVRDREKIKAICFKPLFRRLLAEVAKGDGDIKRIVIGDDGNLTADGLDYAYAGVLPELFNPVYWQGREAEGLEFYETLVAAIPESLRDDVVPGLDVTALRRGAAKVEEESPAVERYVRPKGVSPEETE